MHVFLCRLETVTVEVVMEVPLNDDAFCFVCALKVHFRHAVLHVIWLFLSGARSVSIANSI